MLVRLSICEQWCLKPTSHRTGTADAATAKLAGEWTAASSPQTHFMLRCESKACVKRLSLQFWAASPGGTGFLARLPDFFSWLQIPWEHPSLLPPGYSGIGSAGNQSAVQSQRETHTKVTRCRLAVHLVLRMGEAGMRGLFFYPHYKFPLFQPLKGHQTWHSDTT